MSLAQIEFLEILRARQATMVVRGRLEWSGSRWVVVIDFPPPGGLV